MVFTCDIPNLESGIRRFSERYVHNPSTGTINDHSGLNGDPYLFGFQTLNLKSRIRWDRLRVAIIFIRIISVCQL